MIRVLPDTNIIISSVFWRGNPYEVIRRGILGEYQLVISAEILDEVVDMSEIAKAYTLSL
ncbi:hypothetical protein HYX07_00565 [Candidatus Woesearchaeota archaeon]|nr:hypothetical protein [Candidatus Woesearchaeota archaeon]